MQIILTHPTGSPFVKHAVIALQERKLLSKVLTSFVYRNSSALATVLNLLPKRMGQSMIKELKRRAWIEDQRITVDSYETREIIRMLLEKSCLRALSGLRYQSLVDWVCVGLDGKAAAQIASGLQCNAVYCYEDSAAETFLQAKKRKITCFYDLPIVHYRAAFQIQEEEAELFPELSSSIQAIHEPKWKLERKGQEIELADQIIVASSISKNSLLQAGVQAKKIKVVPYGSPVDSFSPGIKKDNVFRALFVGRVGARKGVHYLLDAWKRLNLKNAELILIGVNELPLNYLKRYDKNIVCISSLPHSALSEYYVNSSLLVLPSLVEGFGMVLLEAMASGIPVVASENTAAPDFVTEGVDGFVLPVRATDLLEERLLWCFQNQEQLSKMGQAARATAEKLSWAKYEKSLQDVVQTYA